MSKKPIKRTQILRTATTKSSKKVGNSDKIFKLGIILLIVISLASMGTAIYYQNAYQDSRASYSSNIREPAVGQIIDCDYASIAVLSARADTEGIAGFWPVSPDQKFVMIKMMLLNKSDQVYHLSPIQSARLVGQNGSAFEVSSAPNIQEPLGGPLGSWESVRGEIGFTVPRDQTNFTFEYILGETDKNCLVKVKINL